MAIVEIKGFKFNTHQDIENYCQDNLNLKMPMDGPQWQLHYQNDFVDPDDGKKKCLVVWK